MPSLERHDISYPFRSRSYAAGCWERYQVLTEKWDFQATELHFPPRLVSAGAKYCKASTDRYASTTLAETLIANNHVDGVLTRYPNPMG